VSSPGAAPVAQTMTIRRRDGSIIGEFPGATLREALENAVRDRAKLVGAYLGDTNLGGASLAGAHLVGAHLVGANLVRANLVRANLVGASLDGTNLGGAKLVGAKLVGKRPVLQLGPIGSRSAYLVAYLTDAGVRIQTGCFFGSLDTFRAAVARTHGEGIHGREYIAAVAMIEAHAALWAPAPKEPKP
jgi:hypothetical protein